MQQQGGDRRCKEDQGSKATLKRMKREKLRNEALNTGQTAENTFLRVRAELTSWLRVAIGHFILRLFRYWAALFAAKDVFPLA